MLFARGNPVGLEQRLSQLVRTGLPLRARVIVHWNDHHIPFIVAEHDSDLAVALGVIHVHLRWSQMEVMRRMALGRVSEMIGPFGIGIDRAFRTLGLAQTAKAISAILPAETARWLERFVAGINHAVEHAPSLPPDFRILGLGRERWRVEDVLALGRLTAADATWAGLIPILREPDRTLAVEVWRRAVGLDTAPGPVRQPVGARRIGGDLVRWLGRFGGSNSMAISPSRSASAGACIASDPHLPVMLPNPFLIAGYRSPSFHVVGLMIAGLPFVALGRNPRIAWGGTNLHAASSDLFDISDLPPQVLVERRERLRVRWWTDRTVAIRDSPHGPVVSDLAAAGRQRRGAFALRWMGSMPSDEVTAMLGINRAHDWNEFRAAVETFAAPGQSLVYADAQGHIGKLMAAKLPRRPVLAPADPILPRSAEIAWQSFVTAGDLPMQFDPAEGFVASANERPSGAPVCVGYLFSSGTRAQRLAERLQSKDRHALSDLAALQLDVAVPWAPAFRDELVRSIRGIDGLARGPVQDLVRVLADWDGCYTADSTGALALELLVFHLMRALGRRRRQSLYGAVWRGWDLTRADIAAAAGPDIAKAMRRAATAAARDFGKGRTWGDVHRLRLAHPLGMLPVLGRRYRCGDWPTAGGSETVLRTAHAPTAKRHRVTLATSARHVSDLSDIDANHFVLLGGQDGWLGSATLCDQVPLWQAGRYIQMPLTLEAVRRSFSIRMELQP